MKNLKKNTEEIEKIKNDILNANGTSDETKNTIIFENQIKIEKNAIINIKELNRILKFLFYIGEQENFTAHPKDLNTIPIDHEKHEFQIQKNYIDIKQVKEYAEKSLKSKYMKKLFVNEVKPKIIFDCLFETKFRPLISFENKEEMNNKIYRILNDESLEEINNTPKVDKIFINYKEKLEELKEIYKELKIS